MAVSLASEGMSRNVPLSSPSDQSTSVKQQLIRFQYRQISLSPMEISGTFDL